MNTFDIARELHKLNAMPAFGPSDSSFSDMSTPASLAPFQSMPVLGHVHNDVTLARGPEPACELVCSSGGANAPSQDQDVFVEEGGCGVVQVDVPDEVGGSEEVSGSAEVGGPAEVGGVGRSGCQRCSESSRSRGLCCRGTVVGTSPMLSEVR